MLSFHGDQGIKSKYLARVAAHRAADELVQGTTWSNGKGCAIGCTLETYDHSLYPIELGVPMELARLEDRIFEALTPEEAQGWPERFLSAIDVGRDLALVWPRFAIWILRDLETKFAARAPKSSKACGDVAALCDRWVSGDKPSTEEWGKARSAADAADAAAADAAAAAAADAAGAAVAAAGAVAAAYVAAYVAASCAYAYAASCAYAYAAYVYDSAYAYAYAAAGDADGAGDADRRDARQKFWTNAAAKLEELLKAA